ncbi:hypothetical protein D3C72_1963780 [compost metagenome]
MTGELGHDQIQRPAGDEAEIPRADTGPITRLLPQQLQVDLLVAEAQRPPPRPEADGLHLEGTAVKRDRAIYVAHRQYQMVDMADHASSLWW